MSQLFDLDHWNEIRITLTRNRLRTLLTAFGIFWGIFLLMIMLGSGAGLHNGVSANFGGTATNSFFLWTQRTQKPYAGLPAGRRFMFNLGDVEAIRQRVKEVEVVAPRRQLEGFQSANNVTRGRKSGSFTVMGDVPEIQRVQAFKLSAGRFLNRLDLEDARKVAVIGPRVREVLFAPGEDPIGQSIVIQGVFFQVVGVFAPGGGGDSGDRERTAQTIFLPFSVFSRAFNWGQNVGWMAVTSRPDVPASVAEEKVLAVLKERHKVAPDDLRAVGHFNVEEQYNKIQGLFRGIAILVWLVGTGTLAAGAIGVSNIMLIVVRERTKEIGIRRAVGAKPSAIISQIVVEALILTGTAGYFGMVAGIGVVELVRRMLPPGDGARLFVNPDVGLGQALQALAILIGAGLLAGLAPAQRAMQVSPIVALRSE